MSDVQAYLFVVLGVVAAVLIPVLKGIVKNSFPPTAAGAVPSWVKEYVAFAAFALLAALIALAAWRASDPNAQLTWYTAVLIGFSFESVIEKLVKQP